jgi:prevent-host-death family protein
MSTITVRQLRNEVSEIVRRAESGEELTVTVNGRPAARIVPLVTRPRSLPWQLLDAAMARSAADPGLAADLSDVLAGSTDDL